jgi:hypothetical protein
MQPADFMFDVLRGAILTTHLMHLYSSVLKVTQMQLILHAMQLQLILPYR